MPSTAADRQVSCYHCGEPCIQGEIRFNDKLFCCEGCRMVYQLLDKSGLCEYYDLNAAPGNNLRKKIRDDKFAFLDDPARRK